MGVWMAEFLYRAYLSYSHEDEAWAKWLHTALESYHVPRRLVGKPGKFGEIPARINPVFRDREDLSAARDLGQRITEALSHSESLIVICSPAAAKSRWVNEEIRQYRKSGQTGRIYCLIVDGEPKPDPAGQSCFPPALFEDAPQGSFEPLAADVRQWADGKRLAKLKLVAGLLGIRLDELRQRDQQRRRKVRAFAGLGVIAVLALVIMLLVAQVSRQHEREMAEQMAGFIVDLGEKLQSETDLETLASISTEALKHFGELDPDKLTAETGTKVALTLRQAGRVSQLQGKTEEAIRALTQSRDLLAALNEKNPESADVLYELGNAEFYIGNLFLDQGDYARTRPDFEKYHEITGRLMEADPGNPKWMMERSYSHNNLAALQLRIGMGVDEASLAHLQAAIDLIEKVMQIAPDKTVYASQYATTLAWAADAQYEACNLENAMALRQKALQLAESQSRSEPGNNDLKRRYAYAISGVSSLEAKTGQLDLAESNLDLVISMLGELSAADPSNMLYPQQIAYRQFRLAKLMAASNRLAEAGALMAKLDPVIGADNEEVEKNEEAIQTAVDFHLTYAGILFQSADKAGANLQLEKALHFMINHPKHEEDNADLALLQEMRFQWWEINGQQGLENFPAVPGPLPLAEGALVSCEDALNAARAYLMEGKPESAAVPVRYLRARGFADPAFTRFCTKYGLCNATPASSW